MRRLFLLVVLAVVLAWPPAGSATLRAAPPAPTLVVLLHSYNSSVDWTNDIGDGLLRGLRDGGMNVDLREEYLDARREFRPVYLQHVREALREKYGRTSPAIVVTSDDAALEFLLDDPTLFAGVPVVFGGAENRGLVARAPRHRFTGLIEEFRVGAVVDAITAVRPATRRVFVVTAATNGGLALRGKFAELRRPGVTFTQLSAADQPLPRLVERLRSETRPDDLVLTTPVVRDVTNQPIDGLESVRSIARASQAPVVGIAFSEVGNGVLATTASTGVTHGLWMARKVIEVWRGASPQSVAIEIDPETRLAFDALELARWDIAESSLGEAKILNATPSFLRTYRRAIWGTAAFVVLQSVVIGGLVIAVRQRRRAEQGLAQQARALSDTNREMAAVNASLVHEQQVRQQAEEHLRHAQKMEAVGRLAGGVAHDFNNLLTVIIGYCALLLEETGEHAPHRDALAQIRRASEQAAALTQNLLAFSRKQVRSAVIVDVSSAIAGLAPMVRRFCGERIDLGLDLDTHTGFVELGEGQLEQVLVNLVINARDAMPDGGRLRVSARAATVLDAARPSPSLEPGPYVVIAVSDSGHGMDDETRARIFEPFFTTKEMGHGTGLGLATVYGIVTQHGGAVTVESRPGEGATFTVWLPRTERRPLRDTQVRADVLPAAGQTVLLVEDEAALRELASLILRQAGFVVLEAADGDEATALAARHPGRIDLLLSDVVMPGPDGFEVARRLRASRPDLAVAFMSGYSEPGTDTPGPDAERVEPLLAKPFMPHDLLTHVRRALDRRVTAVRADGA
jgi:signal transduction histidine kinase/ActR/RegA family two-component response regulator